MATSKGTWLNNKSLKFKINITFHIFVAVKECPANIFRHLEHSINIGRTWTIPSWDLG